MSKNDVPERSPEQRKESLELAMVARRRRAELRRDMKAGKLTLANALEDDRAQRLHVRQLLMSLPGIGSARAATIMRDAGIGDGRRVRGLGPRQRENILRMTNSI